MHTNRYTNDAYRFLYQKNEKVNRFIKYNKHCCVLGKEFKGDPVHSQPDSLAYRRLIKLPNQK